MNELALFAGVGGGMLGTHFIGINPICGVEKNKYRRSILIRRQNEGHLPRFPIWDDICTFDGRNWRGVVDIISGGFPCQAFSTAARGRNTAANLWPEMSRVIEEVQPTYVFAENVTRKAIEIAAEDCAKMGYKTEMLPLAASDLGGDHVRERYWLLAYTDDKSKLRSTINAKVAECKKFHDGIWQTHPIESRMVNGMAGRVDRYESTGNGQVSIVASAALWALANNT